MWVDRLVLGTSKLGVDGREVAFELLDEYVRLGGRTIDTASVYSDWIPGEPGRAETTIGEWLKRRGGRGDLTIVTKGAHPPLDHMDRNRCDAASIRHDVDQSLRRLGLEQIDLWLLHRDDPSRPAGEIVGTLQALQREGKIKSFGASNWTLPRLEEALAVPGPNFVATQILGNVFCCVMNLPGDISSVVLDGPSFHHARTQNLSLFLYTSIAHGYFERRAVRVAPTAQYANPQCEATAAALEGIAAGLRIDVANLALAFLLHLGDHVRPIIGARNAGQLRTIWRATEISLAPDTLRAIAAATRMDEFLD